MKQKVTVFGEVLWDVLPDSKLAGGAAMNVAAHLQNFGLDVSFISRVGHDELGSELMSFMQHKSLSTELVQTGETHLTGIAKANISDHNEVTYKILHPVAWDYIRFDEHAAARIEQSDFFIYGTLASRDETTRKTLLRYLPLAKKPVFDVNLRPPHYDVTSVLELMKFARIVKMNEHELKEVTGWLGSYENDRQAMLFIKNHFNLDMLILTCGAQGAMVLAENDALTSHPGFKIKVADTIGSGDAFLGAFLFKLLNNAAIADALEFACATGAFVATQNGALPEFSETEINEKLFVDSSSHADLIPRTTL
jgi:fructokinase